MTMDHLYLKSALSILSYMAYCDYIKSNIPIHLCIIKLLALLYASFHGDFFN